MSVLSFVIFLAVVLLVSGAIHTFLYRGLVRALDPRSVVVRWALRVLAAVLALSYPAARWLGTFAPGGVTHAAHVVAGTWMGLMFHLLWIGAALWALGAMLRLLRLRRGAAPDGGLQRRAAVVATTLAALVLCVIGWRTARAPAVIRDVRVPVKGFTPELADLTIVMTADLHAGELMDLDEVDRRVNEILALEPDLILLPGDILDHVPGRMPGLVASLGRLRAPLGVFASTGNHEYIVGVDPAVALLGEAGIRVLRNSHVLVRPDLVVSAEDDAAAPRFGESIPPHPGILGSDRHRVAVLHLCHTPTSEASERAIEAGADLVVSGHTHGGQIWPFSLLTRLAFPLHHGLYRVGARPTGHQVTTCGVGWWGPPMRLGTAPEIVRIRLVDASAPATWDGRPAE